MTLPYVKLPDPRIGADRIFPKGNYPFLVLRCIFGFSKPRKSMIFHNFFPSTIQKLGVVDFESLTQYFY